ncbi:hypothetical protein [Dysgonomonas sp. Marseille-P4361]|uniref:hypothetical protein n=1 Tax=Dysgonomonas sp. Marseille-P4361 TaxID=2161820 RepID=UPI000D55B2FF|nr:hypothetical protein [Dysgonomonas sp. Marseille-P4361]
MKTKIIGVALILIFSIQGVCAQTLEDEFADLMNKQDFFALQERYDIAKDSLQSETVKLLAEAFLNTAFNQLDKANLKLDTILLAHQEYLGMSGVVASIVTMSDNLKRQGNYRQSADLLQSFLDQTAAFDGLDSLTRKELEKLTLWGALGDGMKPEIIRPERDCEISYFDGHETFKNIIYVDVELNGNVVDFVFDTGADGYDTNLVSEGFARQNGSVF